MLRYSKFLLTTFFHKINTYVFMFIPIIVFTIFMQLQYWVLRIFNYYSLIDGYFLGRTIISVIISALISFWVINHAFSSPMNQSNELSILTKMKRKDIIRGKFIFVISIIFIYWFIFLFFILLNAMIGELVSTEFIDIVKHSFLYSIGFVITMIILTMLFALLSLFMKGKIFKILIITSMAVTPLFGLGSVLTKAIKNLKEENFVDSVIDSTVYTLDKNANYDSYIVESDDLLMENYKKYITSRSFAHILNISNHFDLFHFIGIDNKVLSNTKMNLKKVRLSQSEFDNKFFKSRDNYYAMFSDKTIYAKIDNYWYESFEEKLHEYMNDTSVDNDMLIIRREEFNNLALAERLAALSEAFEKHFAKPNNDFNIFDFSTRTSASDYEIHKLSQVAIVIYQKWSNDRINWFKSPSYTSQFNWDFTFENVSSSENVYKMENTEWTPTWFIIIFYIGIIAALIALVYSKYNRYSFR